MPTSIFIGSDEKNRKDSSNSVMEIFLFRAFLAATLKGPMRSFLAYKRLPNEVKFQTWGIGTLGRRGGNILNFVLTSLNERPERRLLRSFAEVIMGTHHADCTQ